jgi:hypothetical protein
MHTTTIPGIKGSHAIITPTCRANRGVYGAWDEAVQRMRAEYLACCQGDANTAASFHVVLTVDRPRPPAEPGKEKWDG